MTSHPNEIAAILGLESPSLKQLLECKAQISEQSFGRLSKEDAGKAREQQNLDWLKKSLQAAITLEFATIPPYLSALWSIKDELHPVAKSIREVAQEEMLHMALACNMLASLGVTPQINTAVPTYPGSLPGGVHEGLIVGLQGLTKSVLKTFLWIERPVEGVPIEQPYAEPGNNTNFRSGKLKEAFKYDATIGEFYDKIKEAFHIYDTDPKNSKLIPDRQIAGPLAWAVIRNLDNVEYAIELIKHQGEGADNNPEEAKGFLSHFYRFLEVYNEQQYQWNPKKKVLEVVGKLEFPEVWPMAEVPAGGYKKEDVSEEVWYYLDEFDNTYTRLVNQLQGAWTLGGQASLIRAYETMFELEKYAKPLMRIRTPFGGGETYGPCFRYKPDQSTT